MKQNDGTNDVVKGSDSVKKHKLGLMVESDDVSLDSSSDHLVIAEATIIENKNGKHVSFCCPGDEIGVMDKSLETEETVDIDTTLETNNTFESNTTLDTNVDTTLDTAQSENASADTDEFAEDDDNYKIPLTQNVHRERYLKYKPAHDDMEGEEKNMEEADEEEDENCILFYIFYIFFFRSVT